MKLSTLKSIRKIMSQSIARSSLPILNCFEITKDHIYLTDLLIQIQVRHFFPIKEKSQDIIVRSDHFLQVMSNVTAPFFISSCKGKNIAIEQPDSVTQLRNENIDGTTSFPARNSSHGMELIFKITPHELAYMDIASQFVADDQLRPIMQTVCVGKDFIVSSDAHVLYYRKIGIADETEVLFHRKIIKLMMLFPSQTFQIGRNKRNLFAVSEDITICWNDDSNNHLYGFLADKKSSYPNWKLVLPKVEHTIILPVKETIDALKAVKFALNPATGQVRFQIKGNKLIVKGRNYDYDLEASESVSIVNADHNTLEAGFKQDFVLRILKCFLDEGYSQITMGYIDNTRAFVFGDQILCMPMMID